MKTLISLFIFLSGTSAFADNVVCKQIDAQIVAQVQKIEPLPGTGLCTATLDFEGDKALYKTNECPLMFDEVLAKGVVMKCNAQPGDMIVGLVYRSIFDVTVYYSSLED
jgi:hypothetical protein